MNGDCKGYEPAAGSQLNSITIVSCQSSIQITQDDSMQRDVKANHKHRLAHQSTRLVLK